MLMRKTCNAALLFALRYLYFTSTTFSGGKGSRALPAIFPQTLYPFSRMKYENKYILLGTDHAGNLLEIMYNEMEDGALNVFHAQPCRNIYLPLLKE